MRSSPCCAVRSATARWTLPREGLHAQASGDRRLRSERERLYNKVRQLEQEIALLENNIGFFAKSKTRGARGRRACQDRPGRGEMAAAIEKVKLIDRQAQEEGGEPQKE